MAALLQRYVRIGFKAVLILFVFSLGPAVGLAPCPPANELLAKAKVVVEARVKSLSIGESGFLLEENFPTRMIRADLQITRVIKGEYPGNEAIVYGTVFPPGPFKELTQMALFAEFEGRDTFEWELSRHEMAAGAAFFSMNDCIYYKFPDYAAGAR